jgi:NUMOD3 motif
MAATSMLSRNALYLKHKQSYVSHKSSAKIRKIDFLLTYDEWFQIWFDSGHLEQRGCRLGQYVMSRPGDIGPYSVDNVRIITNAQNTNEAGIGNQRRLGIKHTDESKLKIAVKNKGKQPALGLRHTDESKQKISKASKGNKSNLGRNLPSEHKKKISEGAKLAWAIRKAKSCV